MCVRSVSAVLALSGVQLVVLSLSRIISFYSPVPPLNIKNSNPCVTVGLKVIFKIISFPRVDTFI